MATLFPATFRRLRTKDRAVFCEYHAEGVMNPSIMLRQGQFKYHYFHNRDAQLFDLESDPNEWHNLTSLAEYAEIEHRLRDLVLAQFDVDEIMPIMMARLQQKKIVRQAMHRNNTHWDYQPHFDATQQYMRASADDPYMRK